MSENLINLIDCHHKDDDDGYDDDDDDDDDDHGKLQHNGPAAAG